MLKVWPDVFNSVSGTITNGVESDYAQPAKNDGDH
jgi:hypothetical protein